MNPAVRRSRISYKNVEASYSSRMGIFTCSIGAVSQPYPGMFPICPITAKSAAFLLWKLALFCGLNPVLHRAQAVWL